MKSVYVNLGKIRDFLLSLLFVREDFSYAKILDSHIKEQPKIGGKIHAKPGFLYLLPYRNYVREMIWSFKFRNNKRVAILLGKLLADTLPEYLIEWEQFENFDNPLLICVPSSRKRILKRGFDQNHLIIQSFLKKGGAGFITYQKDAVKKIKHTPRQSRAKTRQERLNNPKDAFAVVNAPVIKGRNIILFDDILTTGATIKEVQKVLERAGARSIHLVVIAH